MNELVENKNYNMQDLVNLMGQNMSAVNIMSQQMGIITSRMDNMQVGLNSLTTSVTGMKQDITDIKENEEITNEQAKAMRWAVTRRVYAALDIPVKKSERSMMDKITIAKYGSLFFSRCWADVKRDGHVGDPSYRTTRKKDYDSAMRDIEAWRPEGGTEALKREADEIALARRIAEEQGYTDKEQEEKEGDKRESKTGMEDNGKHDAKRRF